MAGVGFRPTFRRLHRSIMLPSPRGRPPGRSADLGGLGLGAGGLRASSSAARAASQSRLNWTMPLSVSGWWTICWNTLNGSVAMCEPERRLGHVARMPHGRGQDLGVDS